VSDLVRLFVLLCFQFKFVAFHPIDIDTNFQNPLILLLFSSTNKSVGLGKLFISIEDQIYAEVHGFKYDLNCHEKNVCVVDDADWGCRNGHRVAHVEIASVFTACEML
jgi:hypothetical protein